MPSPVSTRSPSTRSAASSTPTWSCSTTSFRRSRRSRPRSTASCRRRDARPRRAGRPRPGRREPRAPCASARWPKAARAVPTAIDYFVFTAGLFDPLPPFVVGRARFDNWLVWQARQRGAVVDATRAVVAVHQRHDYAHVDGRVRGSALRRRGAAERGARGGKRRIYTIFDASHRLRAAGAVAATWARRFACARTRARPPGSSLSAVGSLRRWPTADRTSWCSTSTTGRRRGDRQPARRPLRVAGRGVRRHRRHRPAAGPRRPPDEKSVLNGVRVLRTRSTAFDRTKLTSRGAELHHLSRRQPRRARSARAPGPRALHDRSADRRRSRPRSSRGAAACRCS